MGFVKFSIEVFDQIIDSLNEFLEDTAVFEVDFGVIDDEASPIRGLDGSKDLLIFKGPGIVLDINGGDG